MMKITKHITFFYLENRIQYINRIIDETNKYEYLTDIYIHTNNKKLEPTSFNKYTNGCLHIIYHDLTNIDPFLLSWKCRDLLQQQKNDYDIFMYIEDDILVPYTAIKYWLKYDTIMKKVNCNVGFVRIEVENDTEYITDLFAEKLDTITHFGGQSYCVNNKNPYCAFWIYDKIDFNKFVSSEYYDMNNIHGYGTREKSAIGLHSIHTKWYNATLIPIRNNNQLIDDCRIYHMPNNYVVDKTMVLATIKFAEAVNLLENTTSYHCGKTLYIDSTDCPTELCGIGFEMNTDKSPFAMNSICCGHRKGYTAVYSMLFSQYKNKVINFAEIGIEAGASLLTWNKYFSEKCNLYAFEFENHKIENCKKLNLKNVTFVHTDVNRTEYLDSTFKETNVLFDVIIDDSTHSIEAQNNIVNTVSKYLKSGGMLIIEDIDRTRHINMYKIDSNIWDFHTFIVCHHNNRFCSDNDKILYLIKK